MNDHVTAPAAWDDDDPRTHPEGCTCLFCIPGA